MPARCGPGGPKRLNRGPPIPGAMAGLIGLTSGDIDLQDALQAPRWKHEGAWIPHPVVRLSTTLPVAVTEPDGVRAIVRARWGFPLGGGRPVGNARDDKLLESRLWSGMLAKSPCLVAATGIYEMTVDAAGAKSSFWFRRRDGRPIVMPGLASPRNLDAEARLCCAIVTTKPSPFFAQFHDRQVCALDRREADAWMAEADPERAVKLLRAPGNDEWEAVPVDGRIFKPGRVETEHLIETGPALRWGEAAPPKKPRPGTLDRWS